MKRASIILLVFLFGALPLMAQVKGYNDIKGRWEILGEDSVRASLEIIDSSNIYLTYMGEKRKVESPTLDTKKNPAWFDFTINDAETGPLRVKTLIFIYGNGIMKWQLFIDEERSPYFTSTKGELMYLKKSDKEASVATTQ